MCKTLQKIILMFLILITSFASRADDIDILNTMLPKGSNILFVMDLSGSMSWDLSGVSGQSPSAGEERRIDVLKGAFQDIINDTDFDDINIGLSVFSGSHQDYTGSLSAHGITYPIAPIQGVQAQTVLSNGAFIHPSTSYMPGAGTRNTREYLTEFSSDLSIWNPYGVTPLVDALYEAVLYFRGENVDLGRYFPDDVRSAHPSTYTGSLSTVPGSCSMKTVRLTRLDPAGGTKCKKITYDREKCGKGETSCGLGTNCQLENISPVTRICNLRYSTINQCVSANPTYHSCYEQPVWSCSANAEGVASCKITGTRVICKEDRTRYFCDETPSTYYKCNFQVEKCEPSTMSGNITYNSPIKTECANNGVILLTDGKPTARKREAGIKSLAGITSCAINDYDADGQDDFSSMDANAGQCGKELAEFMNTTDHNASLAGKQNISLYTIGLSLSAGSSASSYLHDLAKSGGGAFISAGNREQLTSAFKQAIIGIGKKAHSFSSPTYTVNTSTMLTHGKFVYVSVFDRTPGSFWKGNLKKYELNGGELYGKNMAKATDASGALKDDVSDLWSASSISESTVKSGGLANNLNPSTRNVLTDNGASLVNIATATASQLGVTSDQKGKLIDFIKGKGVAGKPRFHMGDIIHSKPVQLMTGGTDSVIFIGSNEGFIHGIQSSTGKELFAYMPQELLKNIKPQYFNIALDTHLYGVDAPLTLFDKNNDGIQASGESVALYFGLRRGGKAYYGLDVTNPSSPQLKWKFTDPKLGYSWSQPIATRLKYGGATIAKNVLIFGGGYVDDNHIDSNTPDTDKNADRVGASVFIVNADTGALIKRITGAELEYAVPSKIKVIDIDRNGSADRLYFADTGGNVLRVDLDPNKDNSIDDYKLTKLASLGGDTANQRKFFNAPDVALFKKSGRVVLTVSIGSGDRPNPLETTVDNNFFMLLDENVFKTPVTSQNIMMSDLYSAPLAADVDLIKQLGIAGGKRGWKISLNRPGLSGEKSLSSSVTFQNKVLFTTFGIESVTTQTNNDTECSTESKHKSSLYVLDLITGKAAIDLDGDGSVGDGTDSFINIAPGGDIPETPQIIRGDFKSGAGGECTNTDCSRTFGIHAGTGKELAGSASLTTKQVKSLPRVYWLEHDQ